MDFSRSPEYVIWETTRSGGPARDPAELNADEGLALADQAAAAGARTLLFSGSDPLLRSDLEALVRRASGLGLRAGVSSAASERLTRERLASLRAAGLDHAVFALDGANALEHDAPHRTPGAFARVLQAVGWCRELGVATRIHTSLGAGNDATLDNLIRLVAGLPIARWSVHFAIRAGSGDRISELDPGAFESAFERLHRLTFSAPFEIDTVEAPHFRRFVAQKETAGGGASGARVCLPVGSGDGTIFVDHSGAIRPSEFFPETRGNVRTHSLGAVYRSDALFMALRDRERLNGKCWACEYRRLCGGSRARARAATGNAWAPDPACSYVPAILR